MDTISEKEQKSGALTRNTWIILIVIIILGGTYTALILLFEGFVRDIDILDSFIDNYFYSGPFILTVILSFLLTRKIKISLIAGVISFVLNLIFILVMLGLFMPLHI